jgi:hypothetical protein
MKTRKTPKMTTIRTHLTFTFDERKFMKEGIQDRLDDVLMNEFDGDVDDIHTRWYSRLSDAPLFGAGSRR